MTDSRYDVHVCLVSEQAAPNLLAALDPSLRPAEAVLMVSAKMNARADALAAVLTEAGVRTARVSLDNEHDFHALEAALLDVASQREGRGVALNVTGGTKLMALAAQSVAQAARWPVFYVDVDTDEVIWLGRHSRRQPLAQRLRLRHYLRGYGFTIEPANDRPHTSLAHERLTGTLLTQIGSLERALGQLNWLAQQAEGHEPLTVELTEKQCDSRGLDALLRNFVEAGVLSVADGVLTFPGEAERAFAGGGWLERHVYRMIEAATGPLGIRDKAANLVVTDRDGVKNELDAAFLARNRLFIIECKTARMDRPEAPRANDALFKLCEICRRVGGLGTRGMLASYRPLRDNERRLARALGIELVCGPELAHLDEKLAAWVRR